MAAKNTRPYVARREFMASTAAAAAFTIVKPGSVRGARANSTIEIALLGCGGRGNWIAPRFVKNGPYKFVACADYFQDKVDAFGEKYGVPASRRYTTLSAYKKLVESKLDAVVIETPPYAHPVQAAAAVDAGKHVFVAKPIAVDVPGCVSIGDSGKRATAKKLVFLVDFQTRADPYYQEAARRVHAGEIGKLVCGEARYPWAGGRLPVAKTPEERLARWYTTVALSGDFIIEQNIHSLDVATWFINADPIKAVGTGGRKGLRPFYGDDKMYDHFHAIFTFPDDVILSYNGVQAIPEMPDSIPCRVCGSRGVVDTDYFTHVWIKGFKPYKGGTFNNLYDSGAVNNIKSFCKFITEGHYANETVAPSVRSNLTCVLGRTAGYQHGEVTWADMMKKNERLEPDFRGLEA